MAASLTATSRLFVHSLLLSALLALGAHAAEAPPLPGYAADLSQTSISGLSSGAFMATQFHVAYSASLVGVGVVAGGPYYCAGSYDTLPTLHNALFICMSPLGPGPDGAKLAGRAAEFAAAGLIDDPANLADDRVYLFSGMADRTVVTKVVDQTGAFYRSVGVAAGSIRYDKSVDAGHAIITDNQADVACATTHVPFINDCGFEQSHLILHHIYGDLDPPAASPTGRIVAFDQDEFVHSGRASMSAVAYAYVPRDCELQSCRVHVALHGCEQGAKLLGDRYYTGTGYNELADTNRLIVLYPQVEPSDAIPYNPKGCWDFWGYSSPDPDKPDFHTRDAPQMAAIMAMLKRLAEPREPTH